MYFNNPLLRIVSSDGEQSNGVLQLFRESKFILD